MITGAHTIIYSTNPEADKMFFKDILKFPYIDIGHDWLIFALRPSELAIHPSEEDSRQELYLMCDDINEFIKEMKECKIKCSKPDQQRWGTLTSVTLPGGGTIGVYEPRHERPAAGT